MKQYNDSTMGIVNRPLTNRELEERLDGLIELFKFYVQNSPTYLDKPYLDYLFEGLENIQKDLQE